MEEWARGCGGTHRDVPFFADASEQLNGAFLVFAPTLRQIGLMVYRRRELP